MFCTANFMTGFEVFKILMLNYFFNVNRNKKSDMRFTQGLKNLYSNQHFLFLKLFSNFQTQIHTWSKKWPYETLVYFSGSLVICRHSPINNISVSESSNLGYYISKTFFQNKLIINAFFYTVARRLKLVGNKLRYQAMSI